MFCHQFKRNFPILFFKILVTNEGRISYDDIKLFFPINTLLIVGKKVALDYIRSVLTGFTCFNFIQFNTSNIVFNGLI